MTEGTASCARRTTPSTEATLHDAVTEHGVGDTMRAIVNATARHRGWAEPFAAPVVDDLPIIDDPTEIGPIYESVITSEHRDTGGVYYTPLPLAEFTTTMALDGVCQQVLAAARPNSVLRILAVDPSCGAGIFLVCALRTLARRFAELLSGEPDPADAWVRYVMPEVATSCIFGMDIDPIAIDLAKSAVWLAGDGRWMPDLLDRNIVVCDPLSGPDAQPPALADRLPSSPTVDHLIGGGS